MNTGKFLTISHEELERARRRIKEPAWCLATDRLRTEANLLLADAGPSGTYDCSWYDAKPDRDFSETYVLFHDYCDSLLKTGRDASTLLRAGALFGDDRYLERGRQWTLHAANHFKFHVQHHDAGYCYSSIGTYLAEAAKVLDAHFSNNERLQLHRQLTACGEAILHNTQHWLTNLAHMPYSNHYAIQRRGLLALGLVLDRPVWVDLAINGVRGFGDMLAGCTMDDGLCYESSTLYHFGTLNDLMTIAELVRHQPEIGRDLYRETFANGRSLKQMFDAPLGLLLPNGERPALGDCYANRDPLWIGLARYYEIAFAIYRDPHYAWLLQRGGARSVIEALLYGADRLEPAEAPQIRSRIWVEHGYALLSSHAGPNYFKFRTDDCSAPFVAVLNGDASGIHHHKDKLSLIVSATDLVWIEDIESAAIESHGFSASIQAHFNRTMLAHNLVVVDETDQKEIDHPLTLAEFRELPTNSTIMMTDLDAHLYPGVRMARTVTVTPDYCLDVFQADSARQHTYDWLVHPRADQPVNTTLTFTPATLPNRAPYSFLRKTASAPFVKTGITLEWSQTEKRFRADVAACGSSGEPLAGELIRAEWPVKSDWSTEGREMLMIRLRAPSATFVALYQTPSGSGLWRVLSSRRLFNGKYDEIRITIGNGREKRHHIIQGIAPGVCQEPVGVESPSCPSPLSSA